MARAPSRSSQLRRQQAIDTLLELAAELPPSQIRTAQISTRMGLSEAALFRHFPSKASLWLASLEYAIAETWRLVEQAGNPDRLRPPIKRLQAVLRAQLSANDLVPGLPALIVHELQNRSPSPSRVLVDTHLQRLQRRLAELVQEVRHADGRSPIPGAPPLVDGAIPDAASEGLANTLLSFVMGLLLQERIRGMTVAQAEAELDTALSLLLPQQ